MRERQGKEECLDSGSIAGKHKEKRKRKKSKNKYRKYWMNRKTL